MIIAIMSTVPVKVRQSNRKRLGSSLSQSYRNFGPAHLLAPAPTHFNPLPATRDLYVRVNSSREHSPPGKPRAFDARRVPEAGYLAVNNVPDSRAFANKNNLLRDIMSSFPMALRVKGFKHRHFGIRRTFIDQKRHIKPIKPFALSLFGRSDSFCDLFYAVLLS